MSLLLFALVIDYLMRNVKVETGAGIHWVVNGELLDLDYADNVILICNGPEEIQKVLDCLAS